MFGSKSDEGYSEILPGIRIKTLVHGANSTMTEFVMAAGAKLPLHSHVHEQTGYMVSGKFRLTVEGKSKVLTPGCSWCVPPDARHEAEVLEDSVVVEVFSPRREEYHRYANAADVEG